MGEGTIVPAQSSSRPPSAPNSLLQPICSRASLPQSPTHADRHSAARPQRGHLRFAAARGEAAAAFGLLAASEAAET